MARLLSLLFRILIAMGNASIIHVARSDAFETDVRTGTTQETKMSNNKEQKTKYPQTLYVSAQPRAYPLHDYTELIGKETRRSGAR